MEGQTGKVAIITGAAGGLGSALARCFAREGYRLFLTDCQKDRLDQLLSNLSEEGAEVCGRVANLASAAETRAMIERAFQTFGASDVLINNAAVSSVKSLWELEEPDWDAVLDVNVKGLFFALQAAAKHMAERGGSIINIASVAGRLPRPTLMHYAASKAAVISITRSAALALAKNNIRVNAIAPGMIDTDMLRELQTAWSRTSNGGEGGQPSSDGVPLGRIARPGEIAAAALYLASKDAAYITGQTLNVCGGIVMS